MVIPGFMGMMSTKIDLINVGKLECADLRASACFPLQVIEASTPKPPLEGCSFNGTVLERIPVLICGFRGLEEPGVTS